MVKESLPYYTHDTGSHHIKCKFLGVLEDTASDSHTKDAKEQKYKLFSVTANDHIIHDAFGKPWREHV